MGLSVRVGGGRGELQAAGAHTVGLALLRDAQQLDLAAGQDEVAVKQLGAAAPPPALATAHAAAPASATPTAALPRLRALQHVRGGDPQGVSSSTSTSTSSPSSSSTTGAAAVTAEVPPGLGRGRGEGGGGQQVQLAGALGSAGVVVAVGGEEDLGRALFIRKAVEVCNEIN